MDIGDGHIPSLWSGVKYVILEQRYLEELVLPGG